MRRYNILNRRGKCRIFAWLRSYATMPKCCPTCFDWIYRLAAYLWRGISAINFLIVTLLEPITTYLLIVALLEPTTAFLFHRDTFQPITAFLFIMTLLEPKTAFLVTVTLLLPITSFLLIVTLKSKRSFLAIRGLSFTNYNRAIFDWFNKFHDEKKKKGCDWF